MGRPKENKNKKNKKSKVQPQGVIVKLTSGATDLTLNYDYFNQNKIYLEGGEWFMEYAYYLANVADDGKLSLLQDETYTRENRIPVSDEEARTEHPKFAEYDLLHKKMWAQVIYDWMNVWQVCKPKWEQPKPYCTYIENMIKKTQDSTSLTPYRGRWYRSFSPRTIHKRKRKAKANAERRRRRIRLSVMRAYTWTLVCLATQLITEQILWYLVMKKPYIIMRYSN
jgi:hypothetical protein